jgi:serine/threonine protein kinase
MGAMQHDKSSKPKSLLGGRYQILGRLGMGGMAEVLHARDTELQRQVAIKLLKAELIDDPSFQARFLEEARAAAKLSHPNIVTIYDFGHEHGSYFIVMEYVPGTDLKALLKQRSPLPLDESVELMAQICAGVGYAHRSGLVHCDLKPQNILITSDRRAKITDFGIARALASIHPDETSDLVWGSPQYFAPEQASGGPPSPATDVYSLGVIFYEMLTGHLPFEATDAAALAEMHQIALPPLPTEYNPDIPPAIEQMLLKVLSKEPSARYRNADQFGRVLTTFSNIPPTAETLPPFHASLDEDGFEDAFAIPRQVSPAGQVDWLAVGLGLLAFLALGGLIPLWLWVCLLYPGCPIALP